MGRILLTIFTLLFALATRAEPVISSAPICEGGETKASVPVLRLGLSANAFENQVLKILKSQIPSIQDTVADVDLQDLAVGGSRGSCEKYKSEPGFDDESLCLYLPKILLGEEIAIREFKKELKESIGLRMNFDNIQIPEFELQNPTIQCRFRNRQAICDISIDVPKILVQSQFDFIDPRKDKKIFSTVSPAELKIQTKENQMPRIRMVARLNSDDLANEAIEIDRKSMAFEVPPSALSSKIQNNEEDIVPRVLEAIESRLDPNLSEKERAQAALEFLDSEEGTEVIETFTTSYGLISLAMNFIGDSDILANFQEPLLDMVEEPLSVMLTEVIEQALPFEKSVELTHPFAPLQDEIDRDSYLIRFQKISDYLDDIEARFAKAESYRSASEIRRSHSREIKNIGKFAERLQSSQLKIVGDELRLLEFRLHVHLQTLDYLAKSSKSLRKAITKTISKVAESAQVVKEFDIPLYRSSQLHIDRVGRVSKDGIEVIVSGCHVGGLLPNAPNGWTDLPMNKSVLNDNHFAVEIPISLVNQHMRLLQANGFYDYCSAGKEKTCAENNGLHRTEYKIKKAPRIREIDSRYFFEIPEIQRTSYTFLPNFFDKALLRDSTKLQICLDGLVVKANESSIIPEDCINATANIGKNFRIEHLMAFILPPLGLGVLGLKLTHTAIQQILLDNLKKGIFRARANSLLVSNDEYNIRELRVENSQLSIYGRIVPKSEQQ